MKIRIKGNSVRLRLSKSEVENIGITGAIEERTCFGNNIFYYALEATKSGGISADYDGNKITIYVPEEKLVAWSGNDETGFNAAIAVNDEEQLNILVEKDFKCLDDTTEDQTDNFENPKQSC